MVMRTRTFIVCLFVLLSVQMQAQELLAGGYRHVIDVESYPYYGKGFLTIVDAHYYKIGEEQERVNISYDYTDPLHMGGEVVPLSLVVAVDGVSAEGWTPDRFYQVVDGRKTPIKLRLRAHKNGEIVEYDTEITPRYGLPDYLKVYGYLFSQNYYTLTPDAMERSQKNSAATYTVQNDHDYDFFNVRHHDYYITGGDVLLDKEIFGEVDYLGSVRVPQDNKDHAPDVLFTIAKDIGQSIESIYVPPTSRVVKTESYASSSYDRATNSTVTTTNSYNRFVRESGYTTSVGKTELFLEIAALDYSKIDDPSISYAPVVWKSTVRAHFARENVDAAKALKDAASWLVFGPFDQNIRHVYKGTLYAPLGVVASSANPAVIETVVPGTKAEELGLQPGDRMVKLTFVSWRKKKDHWEYPSCSWSNCNDHRLQPFFEGQPGSFEIVYERNGKKKKIVFNSNEQPLKVSTCFICTHPRLFMF